MTPGQRVHNLINAFNAKLDKIEESSLTKFVRLRPGTACVIDQYSYDTLWAAQRILDDLGVDPTPENNSGLHNTLCARIKLLAAKRGVNAETASDEEAGIEEVHSDAFGFALGSPTMPDNVPLLRQARSDALEEAGRYLDAYSLRASLRGGESLAILAASEAMQRALKEGGSDD